MVLYSFDENVAAHTSDSLPAVPARTPVSCGAAAFKAESAARGAGEAPACGAGDAPAQRAWSTAELTALRERHCGANVALNYRKAPLHLVKGRAQFLYDAEGAEHLDCVNNVCHVGHCHPDVVAAACEQIGALNTNARYLSAPLLEYAQQLTATLPGLLRVVYWTNSGSEANDLALRLARAHTKRRGVLCVGGAYHGHVSTMIDASPYKFERESGGQRCGAANIVAAVTRLTRAPGPSAPGCARRPFQTCIQGCTVARLTTRRWAQLTPPRCLASWRHLGGKRSTRRHAAPR